MKYIIDTDKLPCNNGKNCTTCPFWSVDDTCEINEQVKKLPKYEERPHGEWISCSERLPEESGQYYVSGGDKVWICSFLIIPTFKGGWCNNVSNPVVEAWMPLPEPYKRGEAEMTREEADILRDLWRFSVSEKYTEKEIRDALDKAIEALKETPQWIPCSERLPEEYHSYLVTKLDTNPNGSTFTTLAYFYTEETGWDIDGVIAWMPFPKPYKKEGEAE